MAAAGNFYSHNYEDVTPRRVLKTSQEDLSLLRAAIEQQMVSLWGAAKAYSHDHKRPDEPRAKSDACPPVKALYCDSRHIFLRKGPGSTAASVEVRHHCTGDRHDYDAEHCIHGWIPKKGSRVV
jgi:hypothetical protein